VGGYTGLISTENRFLLHRIRSDISALRGCEDCGARDGAGDVPEGLASNSGEVDAFGCGEDAEAAYSWEVYVGVSMGCGGCGMDAS
jgi:hypothetical protein